MRIGNTVRPTVSPSGTRHRPGSNSIADEVVGNGTSQGIGGDNRGPAAVSRYFCKAMQTVMTTQKTNSDAMYELIIPHPVCVCMCPH